MNLIVAATNTEIAPFLSAPQVSQKFIPFVSGAGCLETSLNLTRFLAHNKKNISRIIHVGIAGAFQNGGGQLLDICIAQKEVFADFGVCYGDRIEGLDFPECPETEILMHDESIKEINLYCDKNGISYMNGVFLTVNSVSGTEKRGNYLQSKHQALCENMEGFAVARVCQEFQLPCLEVRCVSNLVEDRNPQNWVIDAACKKLGHSLTPFMQ